MSAPVPLKFTYDDYVLLPEDRRYEIIDGNLFLTPAPRTYHQKVCGGLFAALLEHVRGNALGEVLIAPCDLVLSATNVVQPDILFVRKERLAIIGERFVSAAPDLVVEVLSPGTTLRDRRLKSRLYARFGVGELWIVDVPARRVEVFENAGSRFRLRQSYGAAETLRSRILPKLVLPLDSIF